MARSNPVRQATFEEFLHQAQSPIRHEFVDGFVFAMTGGTDYHNQIAINALFVIRAAARAAGCEGYITDMLLQAPGGTYYPDVLVTCEEPNDGSRLKYTACLIIEVLSESTEIIDRSEKLHNHQKLPGLQACVLVSQDKQLVEVFRRLEDKSWRYEAIETGEIQLPYVNVGVRLDELYQGMNFA